MAAVAAVVVVDALLVAWAIASAEDEAVVNGPERLVAPSTMPTQGSLVVSEVRADGTVAVTQWIRGPEPLGSVTFSSPATSERVRVTDSQLVAEDGTVLAEGFGAGATSERVPVDGPSRLVRATYVLDGVTEVSSDVPGRLLVQAVALPAVAADDAGPVVVEVAGAEADSVVRNLACSDPGSSVAIQRPCGSPDGSAWRVRLTGGHRDEIVTAQVDLP